MLVRRQNVHQFQILVDNLGLPELYERLPGLFELNRFESRDLEVKAAQLQRLVEEYVLD